jgi:hypothetical protein
MQIQKKSFSMLLTLPSWRVETLHTSLLENELNITKERIKVEEFTGY